MMAVDRVRPHFEIDVGSGLILDTLGGHHRSRFKLVTGVRANFAARVSHWQGRGPAAALTAPTRGECGDTV